MPRDAQKALQLLRLQHRRLRRQRALPGRLGLRSLRSGRRRGTEEPTAQPAGGLGGGGTKQPAAQPAAQAAGGGLGRGGGGSLLRLQLGGEG